MRRLRFSALLVYLVLMTGIFSINANSETPPENSAEPSLGQNLPSLHSIQANWTFSGIVTNESGERYHYFFQIERSNTRFHGYATVMDAQTKSVLIYEESSTLIQEPELTHWQVGNLFMRFNPINNSWVFGVTSKGKKGFNFKVDTIGLSDAKISKKQTLSPGIEFLISQTGRLNGHIQIDDKNKEEFVTAKKAWFSQIWVSKTQSTKHPVNLILCEFNNGSALYSVTIPESDALRGSVAGWRDENGQATSISQFVTIEQEKDDSWLINIQSPKLSLSFKNLLDKINEDHELIMGLTSGLMSGFCAMTHDDIDAEEVALASSRQLASVALIQRSLIKD